MAKASPRLVSANAGEHSPLIQGRVDLERHASSSRRLWNTVALPQGPATRRPGTLFVNAARDATKRSKLEPFVFSSQQALMLEFSNGKLRFFSDDGIIVEADKATTIVSNTPLVVATTGHGYSIGDQVTFSGFQDDLGLNGVVFDVTGVAGDNITLDGSHYAATVVEVTPKIKRVYTIDVPYLGDDVANIRVQQTVDVTYVFCPGYRTHILSRRGTYDWTIEEMVFTDGPYISEAETLPRLDVSATGQSIPDMTSNSLPSGYTAADSAASATAWKAFNKSVTDFWQSAANQTGWVEVTPSSAFAAAAYTIHIPRDNSNASFSARDYAPGTFTFEGWTGSAWVVLDAQADYVLYDNYRSVRFPVNDATAYAKFRLNITQCTRNGAITPRVAWLAIEAAAALDITLTTASVAPINAGAGFVATDVDRLVRVKGTDSTWRNMRIKTVTSATQVVATLVNSPPFLATGATLDWQVGLFSDTTGWPTVGVFFDDRLCLAGVEEYPDVVALSSVGGYNSYATSDEFGVVLDDNGIVVRLNARRLGAVRWLVADDRGLLVGTGDAEFVIGQISESKALTPDNVRARQVTRRGSANVEPVQVDNRTVFVQRNGRTLRETRYQFEVNGYVTSSLSQFASHIGSLGIAGMAYAAEPYSLIWFYDSVGNLASLAFDPQEQIVGFHRHDLNGVIESVAELPQSDQRADGVWFVVRRTIDGQTVRYIERLGNFFDFEDALEDFIPADSAVKYGGEATRVLYGLRHLEGETLYGFVNGQHAEPVTVTNGAVTFGQDVTSACLGIGFDSEGETAMIEAGAADGTSQGKLKRINKIVIAVWRSHGGEIAVRMEEDTIENGTFKQQGFVFEPLPYDDTQSFGYEIDEFRLTTGNLRPETPEQGYGTRGSLMYRQPKETPYPFTITGWFPQVVVEDEQ